MIQEAGKIGESETLIDRRLDRGGLLVTNVYKTIRKRADKSANKYLPPSPRTSSGQVWISNFRWMIVLHECFIFLFFFFSRNKIVPS